MLPTFVIIGAMKCGTSSLFYYLKAHPEICMAKIKETDFFVHEKNYSKGVKWYESLFVKEANAYGEASPNYAKDHLFSGVPKRMHALIPDAKLIYMVRDPVERIISHYMHSYALGRENRPISEALKVLEGNNYVLTSMYYRQLALFLEYFPENRILILPAEDLMSDRTSTLQKIFSFLGVSTNYQSEAFEKIHHVSSMKVRRAALDNYIKSAKLRSVLRRLLPSHLTEPTPFGRPDLDYTMRKRIKDHLRHDVEQLKMITGKQFEKWCI